MLHNQSLNKIQSCFNKDSYFLCCGLQMYDKKEGEETGKEEWVDKTRQGDGQDKQVMQTAASEDYHFNKVLPAWLCSLPTCHNCAGRT